MHILAFLEGAWLILIKAKLALYWKIVQKYWFQFHVCMKKWSPKNNIYFKLIFLYKLSKYGWLFKLWKLFKLLLIEAKTVKICIRESSMTYSSCIPREGSCDDTTLFFSSDLWSCESCRVFRPLLVRPWEVLSHWSQWERRCSSFSQ